MPVVLAALLAACGPSWSPEQQEPGRGGAYRLTDDGSYLVRRGDTLYAIAFNFGLDWRDLARWNGIDEPYLIYPDQPLRMSPPARATVAETRPAAAPQRSVTREAEAATVAESPEAPPQPQPQAAQPSPEPSPQATPEASPGVGVEEPDASPGVAAEEPEAAPGVAPAEPAPQSTAKVGPGGWAWPTEGRLLSTFKANDPARNGIDIAGTVGQLVHAASAGEVVYSGNGLIGYGELIIIKHNDQMLSAYAHNSRRLVTEGQRIEAGEVIAEMGRNDRNQAMLHFEIRVNGSPQDPLKYLPPR